jgi:non-ribosomal peptide synthetase component F
VGDLAAFDRPGNPGAGGRKYAHIPDLLRDWLVKERITVAFVPTIFAESMLAESWPAETALRYLLTGGEALHRHPSPGLPFTVVNNYGPTECTVVATSV